MPDNKIMYSVRTPDGRTEQWNQQQYDELCNKLYEKYPDAQVIRASSYMASDSTDVADSDQFQIALPDGRTERWNRKDFDELYEPLTQKYPDARILRMSDMTERYWSPKINEAHEGLKNLKEQNKDFLRQFELNRSVADSLETDGVMESDFHDFVAANQDKYDDIVSQQEAFRRQYYTNPLVVRAYRAGAENATRMREDFKQKADSAEDGAERRDWKRAAKLQDDLRKLYEAPGKYSDEVDVDNGFLDYMRDYASGARDTFTDKDFYTFGLSKISRNFDLRGIAKKLEDAARGRELSAEDIDRILTPGEKAEIQSFYQLAAAQKERADSISSAYNAGGSFAESLKFMAEFMLSQGMANVAGKALSASANGFAQWLGRQLMSERALNRVISKGITTAANGSKAALFAEEYLAKPIIQGLWHSATQLASLEGISEGLLDTDSNGKLVSVGRAVGKGILDNIVENWSESFGGAIEKTLALPFRGLGWAGEHTIANTGFGRWARWIYNSDPVQLFKEAGFNGMIGEIGEEWAGNAVRVGLGLMSPEEFKSFASWQQQLEMAASFAPLSLFGLGTSTISAIRKSKRFNNLSGQVQDILTRQGRSKEEIDDLFNTRFDTAEDVARKLAPYLKAISEKANAEGATEQDKKDYRTVMDFAQELSVQTISDELDKLQQADRREELKNNISATVGQFWFDSDSGNTDEAGNPVITQNVRIATDEDGQTYYVTGSDENGMLTGVSTVDGRHKFLDESKLSDDRVMSLDDYLQEGVNTLDKDAEAKRMNEERQQQIASIRAAVTQNPVIPIGTLEAPINATVVASNAAGVTVAWEEEGQQRTQDLSWSQVGAFLGTPVVVKTDAELEADEAKELDEARERLDTYKNIVPGADMMVNLPSAEGEDSTELVQYKFDKVVLEDGRIMFYGQDENGDSVQFTEEMIANIPELIQGAGPNLESPFKIGETVSYQNEDGSIISGTVSSEDNGGGYTTIRLADGTTSNVETSRLNKEEENVESSAPASEKYINDKTGQVNQKAFMNHEPEEWAKWNDERRKDGGVGTKRTLTAAINELDKQIKAKQKELDNEADPDEADVKEEALGRLTERRSRLNAILEKYNRPAEAGSTIAGEQRKAAAQQARAEQQKGFPGIQQKWNEATKIEGVPDEIRLANGETVTGHYVLTEADAPTASHNPADGFRKTDGFPVDENGKTVNDRDYEKDSAAQQSVQEKAANYDQRALQTPVIVSQDGVVLSGNDRTMASQMAAQNGTDAAYTGYLSKYSQKYGFTAEQVGQFQHPRVVFVPDAAMPYDAATFAKFNADDKKTQNKTEKAVKAGKTVSPETLSKIATLIDRYDDILALYNDPAGVRELLDILTDAGVITKEQVASMMEGDKLSGTGRDIVESALVGPIAEEDAVRELLADPSMRQSVISAIAQILANQTINGYTLRAELSDAIMMVAEAKRSGTVKYGESVQGYVRQQKLFGDNVMAEATVQLLADAINSKKSTLLKRVLNDYNNEARLAAQGQGDLFSENEEQVNTKEDLLGTVLTALGYNIETYDTTGNNESAEPAEAPAQPAAESGGQPESGQQTTAPVRGDVEGNGGNGVAGSTPANPARTIEDDSLRDIQTRKARSDGDLREAANQLPDKWHEFLTLALRTSDAGMKEAYKQELIKLSEQNKGNAAADAVLAAMKKNSALDNTTDTGETLSGEQNDTATLQDTVSSENKDSENSEEQERIGREMAAKGGAALAAVRDAAGASDAQIAEALDYFNWRLAQLKARVDYLTSEEGRNNKGISDDTRAYELSQLRAAAKRNVSVLNTLLQERARRDGVEYSPITESEWMQEEKSEEQGTLDFGGEEEASTKQETPAEGELTEAQKKAVAFVEGKTPEQVEEEHRAAQEAKKAEEKRQKKLIKRAEKWKKFLGDASFEIATSIEDIEKIRDEATRKQVLARQKEYGDVEGWFANGKAVIYLPNIPDQRTLDRKVMHEVISHKGIRGLFEAKGKGEFDKFCQWVWDNLMNDAARARYINYPGVNGSQKAAADEFLAHCAENETAVIAQLDDNFWTRLAEAIKTIINDAMGEDVFKTEDGWFAKLLKDATASIQQGAAAEQEDTGALFSIQGLPGYTEQDVANLVRDHINEQLDAEEEGFSIADIRVIGSRAQWKAREDSDLDVLVQYNGSMREDDAFNALHNEPLEIEGIKVDINPINTEKSGTANEWIRRHQTVDAQGNAINADGSFIADSIASIDELTDADFTSPSRSVILPKIPSKIDAAIGAGGKPVVIKKNIFKRNAQIHKDLTPEQSRDILNNALYNTQLYGQNQPVSRPFNWVVINVTGKEGQNKLVLLEIDENKDNVEIVHWHYIDKRGLDKVKRQAKREGGHILMLPPDGTEEAGALSGRTSGLSSEDKGSETSSNPQASEIKNEDGKTFLFSKGSKPITPLSSSDKRRVNTNIDKAIAFVDGISVKDAEYLDAVEAGDMETAQRIVDQAAQAAGYTVKAFHGSLSKDITRFDKDKIGSRYAYDERGFFFTSSPTIAGYYASSEFDSSRKGKVYPVFLGWQNPLVVDAKFARKEGLGRRFSDMDAIEVWDNYQSFLLDKVDEGDNDGVLINDGQTQMYVVFDANQIKSAEPVTRDDTGKVIPISERFDSSNDDIRFSLRGASEIDKPYEAALRRGNLLAAKDMVRQAANAAMPNSVVRDKNGVIIPVYHDTNSKRYVNRETGQDWEDLDWKERDAWEQRDDWNQYWEERDFYTFDRRNARTSIEMPAFFFAPQMDEYHEYGERTIQAYINLTNPAINPYIENAGVANNAGTEAMQRLIDQGYDGFIRTDDDGNVLEYGVFESSQIKSADAVTKDDNGRVIPLSKRFDLSNSDIRFSIEDFNPIRADQTQTKAFKDWFKGSKIVNEDGSPMVVYRGASFDPLSQEPGMGVIKPQRFFSPSEDYAKRYGLWTRAYFLNIQHPFDVRNKKDAAVLREFLPKGYQFHVGPTGALDWAELSAFDLDELIEAHPEYDGMVFDEGGDPDGNGGVTYRGVSYMPFNGGTQVKSATSNNGEYSQTNPDVRFSVKRYRDFATAQQAQKLPRTEYPTDQQMVRFSLSNRNRTTVSAWLRKRKDLTDDQRKVVVDYLDELSNPKLQLATARWFVQGVIRLPEDMPKVEQAVAVADRAKVDPLQYGSPMELIEAHADIEIKEKPINPDTVSTLHKAKEYKDYGIVVYDVDDTEESRKNMREIINTHYGKEASPWCLLQGDGSGNLTAESARYWRRYNAYPKQVAFKDGKLLAFSANDSENRVWWDRQDRSHNGISLVKEIEGDELGRRATFILDEKGSLEREPGRSFKGNKNNGLYEEWYYNDSLALRERYKDGKQDGPFETYTPSGVLLERGVRKKGELDGKFESWHDNGNKNVYVEFKDGIWNGKRICWYRNGEKCLEENYENGVHIGLSREWWDNGQLKSQANFNGQGGDGVAEFWDKTGFLTERTEWKDGKKNGLSESWWPESHKMRERGEFAMGERIGTHEVWDDDGTLVMRQHYNNGREDGIQESWFHNGNRWLRYEKNNGRSDGLSEEWYWSGGLRESTPYKDGHKHGIRKEWLPDGTLTAMDEYRNGELVRNLLAEGITEEDADAIRFSVVTDKAELERLEKEPTITLYRAMELIDGELYPPMSQKVPNAKEERGKKMQRREGVKPGMWQKSDEDPAKAYQKKKGGPWYYDLKKIDSKQSDTNGVLYNPYLHLSASPLNDQFSAASNRPNLVTVACEVPVSELTSGYKAEKANDTVGPKDWHSGTVTAQLGEGRQVVLSRWAKIGRIVPDSEVASIVAPKLVAKNITVPANVVTPSLRAALEARGVKFAEPEGEDENVRFSVALAGVLNGISDAEVERALNSNLVKGWLKTKGEGQRYNLFDPGANFIRKFAKATLGIDNKYEVAGMFYNAAEELEDIIKYASANGLRESIVNKVDYKNGAALNEYIETGQPLYSDKELAEISDRIPEGMRQPFLDAVRAFTDEKRIRDEIQRIKTFDNGNAVAKAFILYDIATRRIREQYPGEERFFINRKGDKRFKNNNEDRFVLKSSVADGLLHQIATMPLDKIGNTPIVSDGTQEVRFSVANHNQEVFISNAAKAAEEVKMDKATPEQWLKMLEKGGGLKAGEDKWIGLSDWLREQEKKTLTKQDVLDYINQHKIRIEEVHYTETGKGFDEIRKEYDRWLRTEGYDYAHEQLIERYGDDADIAFDDLGGELTIANEEAAATLLGSENIINRTRLDYTTAGLKNKREIALTVPTIEPYNESDSIHFGDAGEGRAIAWARFGEATTPMDGGEKRRALDVIMADNDNWYRSHSQFARYGIGDESLNKESEERKARQRKALADSDAVPKGRVLVIDEIQSKRHQDAREQGGYKDDNTALKEAEKRLAEAYDAYYGNAGKLIEKYGEGNVRDMMTPEESAESQRLYREYRDAERAVSRNGFDPMADEEYRRLRENQRAHEYSPEFQQLMADWNNAKGPDAREAINKQLKPFQERNRELLDAMDERERILADEWNATHRSKVPAAPFEKNWHELAMKRMLRLAAEEGYDYVAWTTGEQQAERYNLSSVVNKIFAYDSGNKDNDRMVEITTNVAGEKLLLFVDGETGVVKKGGDKLGANNKPLADVVGKEISMKILSTNEDVELSDSNLRIGGEGMKGFYDQILPRFMDKYGKKWGVKTEDISLTDVYDEVGHPLVMHSVKVTPEMKESVMGGQLMFSLASNAVQNEGLGGVIGKASVPDFYNSIYRALPSELRGDYVDRAFGNDLDIHKSMSEHLSELAFNGYENDDSGILRLAGDMLRYYSGEPLTDAEVRYILWRSGQPSDSLTEIQSEALRRRWNVDERPADTGLRFSVGDSLNEADRQAGEAADRAKDSLDEKKKDIRDALTMVKAMSAQKAYDRATVDALTNLAKNLMKDQTIDALSRREVARLLGIVRTSVGKAPKTVKKNADTLIGMVIDHLLAREREGLAALTRTTGTKTNATGVEVQGELDLRGQQTLKAYKEGLAHDVGKVDDSEEEDTLYGMRARLVERLESSDDAVREEAEAEDAGLALAIEYKENVKWLSDEEKRLEGDLKALAAEYKKGDMGKSQYEESVHATEDAIRENRIQQVESLRDFRTKMQQMLAGSREARQSFLEREKERKEQIQHLANSDMQGRKADADSDVTKTFWGRVANSAIVRFFAAPLGTFDQMLRLFGEKSVSGEGYLWNKYMRDWQEAAARAYIGQRDAKAELDAKVSEVFGREMRWAELFDKERKMPKATVKWRSADGVMQEHELSQGQLLYIYMVNKMADGRMKLRKMGILQEHVDAIKRQMDERFIELADWLQDEYLVQKRNKYNAIHERLFGASMAAIENYFPLVINKRDLNRNEDISSGDNEALPSTTTGSIIKRRRNNKALDLLNADAFSVVLDHIDQMEQWAAFAEFNKDVNTLLSYKRFRNQVQNMSSVYGAGTTLWRNFKDVCRIAGNSYQPSVKKDSLDSAAVNLAKGVTSAKISFRVFTALKQFLSMPAFVSDANIIHLGKNLANPMGAWKWAMENLPLFEKRWKSRIAGDTRLMTTDMDWKIFRTKVYDKLSQLGMTPNAFVDAWTVAVGAHSMYQTKYDQYIKDGYTEEQADKRAKQDATTLYNETQQSNENAFLSTVQLDRTLFATSISVFRNSSMGYQRQLHDAIRNLGKLFRKGYKEESIAFMTKQMVRDGLSEEQAAAAAERRYNRTLTRNAVRVATFGFLVEFAWNLGSSIVYLLFGDDDDEKEKMLSDAFKKALLGGTMEGLAGGNVLSDALDMVRKGENLRNYDPTLLPVISDMKKVYSMFSYDKVAGAHELVNLAVQAGFGVNPQTIEDVVTAVVDASRGDLDTSKEAMLLIMRVLAVPQSQIDKIYIDELGTTADKARKMSYSEMAERYADYKMDRNAGLFRPLYSDEMEKKRKKTLKKRFKTMVKERKELKRE